MARPKKEAAPAAETNFAEKQDAQAVKAAEDATARAEEEGRLPESSAVTNPAPATEMQPSGAFVEPEILQAVDVDHPSVENNPRFGTSAVQNGVDWNDPTGRLPDDPEFVGQGVDKSVYGR